MTVYLAIRGTVYHEHGVFYEGAGSDEFTSGDEKLVGAYVDDEWGQTGANSSMYKWFDLLWVSLLLGRPPRAIRL